MWRLLVGLLCPYPVLSVSAVSQTSPKWRRSFRQQRRAPVRVFTPGEDGIACYRIPSAVLTAKGTLLAIAEARHGSCGDADSWQIAARRSTDHGRSWSPVQVVAGSREAMVGNPSPIALSNGDVALVYLKRHPNEPNRGYGNGVVFTRDDGLSWTGDHDISAGFGAANGSSPGPGTGVELSNGRLLVVSHHGAYTEDYVSYSDDGGANWQTVNQTFPKMDEGTIADLGGGQVLLNMRHTEEGSLGRAVARSSDGGLTWGNISYDPELVGPICQGSLAAFHGSVFFSNPASRHQRRDLTVRRSTDGGKTWGWRHVVQMGLSNGYSSIVKGPVGDQEHGGVLYESAAEPGAIDFSLFPIGDDAWEYGPEPSVPEDSLAVTVELAETGSWLQTFNDLLSPLF